jgi:hypothetical protein
MTRLARKKRCEKTEKMSYPSKIDAVTAAASMTRSKARALRPYYCGDCAGWHLTRMPLAEGGRRS